jgi:hypothetical protein
MPVIKQNISKGQLVKLSFSQDNVAASQTNAQLYRVEVASAALLDCSEYYMPWGGEIVGIAWSLSAAGTAGQLTVGATVDGTEDADTTQTITTAARGYARVARGLCTFTAGQYLGVEITTNSAWNGTSSDLAVDVYALVYLEGI